MPSDADKTAKFATVPIEETAHSEIAPATIKSELHTEERPSAPMPSTERSLPIPESLRRNRAMLTVLTGVNAGQTFGVDPGSSVIGRDVDVALRFDDAAVSRHHARIVGMTDGRFFVEDLRSTNGTFVGARRIDRAEIRSADRIQVGPNVLLRFAIVDENEEELQRRLFESSVRDALTGLYNRKYLMDRLAAECAHARRHKTELSAILFDLDAFKKVNDTHGHLAGDAVLRGVAEALALLIRLEDLLARYGGEELVILARSTPHADALRLADRARVAIEQLEIKTAAGPLRVTVSAGVASFAELPQGAGPDDLLAKADARLYTAKRDGRNRTVAKD